MMHHRRAGSGRADNHFPFALFADFDETLGHASCLGAIASIESRLPAASLALVKLDRTACSPEHRDRTCANRAPHLIDQTSNKQTDADFRLPIGIIAD